MGRQVEYRAFTEADHAAFVERLNAETERLRLLFENEQFGDAATTIGYEVEACLVDEAGRPADANMGFLERLNMPAAVPELARCNVEFNGRPRGIAGRGLADMQAELDEWLALGRRTAGRMGLSLLMIGILPTLREADMDLEHISPSPRYRILNENVARLRGRQQVALDISGEQHYQGRFDSIMAESAATSFQLHLRLPPAEAARWYNAAQIAAGPLLAAAANSPYLFGHDLWAETRIPSFAQAVDAGDVHFVTFGRGYVASLHELFEENRARYPVLLPARCGDAPGFEHVNLHNGTIWRWNRPVLGEGEPPHLRVEHRSLPAGPTVLDMVANCAFFHGLVAELAQQPEPPEDRLSFASARRNFYRAARHGLAAELDWSGGSDSVAALYQDRLLPAAREGLRRLDVEDTVAQYYLAVLAERVQRGLSGAGWQREWVRLHGHDMTGLVQAYGANQMSGKPLSEWDLRRC
jgi:gamma-glutamyl:cysteine ligase YbdK (ATP-grasp superfamily)